METDEEQVEKLKKWWQENGRSVIAGIVIGVGGLFGYRFWVDYKIDMAEQASGHFMLMVEALETGNRELSNEHAAILTSDYPASDYALLARLALSRGYVEAGDFDRAVAELQQVVGTAGNEPLGYLARARLAAVQLQMSRVEEALGTLAVDFPGEFSANVEELKGDIYARLGRPEEAAEAYRKALRGTPGPADSQFLQQKLDDLGTTG